MSIQLIIDINVWAMGIVADLYNSCITIGFGPLHIRLNIGRRVETCACPECEKQNKKES